MFPCLSFNFIGPFLHVDHFLVLGALLFQSRSFARISLSLVIFVVRDGMFLVFTSLHVSIVELLVVLGALLSQGHLLVSCLLVSLAYFHNINGLLLGLCDFFPSLHKKQRSRKIIAHSNSKTDAAIKEESDIRYLYG